MKTLTKLFYLSICIALFSCDVEPVDNGTLNENSGIENLSAEEFEAVFQDSLNKVDHRWRYNKRKKIATYNVLDADRCGPIDPNASFWWPGEGKDFQESFFSNSGKWPLTFTEYDDGTAQIHGMARAVYGQHCKVFVNIWLKNKKNFEEWSKIGGELKEEGCSEAKAEDLNYYVVNKRKSYMLSCGSDCLGQGVYGFEQRPDPNDADTPNFGIVVGPGGALWDSNVGKLGLAGWGWIINRRTGERLWDADFNFTLEKKVRKIKYCNVIDANRCGPVDPNANFWWPGEGKEFQESFFERKRHTNYTFTEYDNGTAHIEGTAKAVYGQNCVVKIDVWLKDRKNYDEWSAIGGELKEEGCSQARAQDLHYYVVDPSRSTITSSGSDCLGEGTWGLEQRPNPNDPDTPNFGIAVGPGGALWDDHIGAYGLAGWVWLTNQDTGERLWEADFNFITRCN